MNFATTLIHFVGLHNLYFYDLYVNLRRTLERDEYVHFPRDSKQSKFHPDK